MVKQPMEEYDDGVYQPYCAINGFTEICEVPDLKPASPVPSSSRPNSAPPMIGSIEPPGEGPIQPVGRGPQDPDTPNARADITAVPYRPSTTVPDEQNQPARPRRHPQLRQPPARPAAPDVRPASPRSCRTASTSRNSPRIPGVGPTARPRPCSPAVPRPRPCSRPFSTNAPPSPFAQKPRSSRVTRSCR